MVEIETFATSIQQYAPTVQVTSEPGELRNYAVDGLLPRLVVIPDSVEQVAQIVALTNQQGLKLLTRGGGSPHHVCLMDNANRIPGICCERERARTG